jgi:CMP-N,N'-diacetyllegionaminic acid synthase
VILRKKILAIIPARSGSKRLKFKNIKIFKGKPLFMWSLISAKKSKYIDQIYLSTDSMKINNIAKKNGFKINKLRSKKLSCDTATSSDAVFEILKTTKEKFDFFILLQPTSPLRSTRDIDSALKKIIIKNSKSLISVNSKNNKINGAIYIQNINYFKKYKKFKYKNTILYKMPKDRSVDIDTKKDFEKAKNISS